jgi:hypothetical protein
MATQLQAAPDQRATDHSQPLDSCINALEETPCLWRQGLLRLLKQHLESAIPAGREVLN